MGCWATSRRAACNAPVRSGEARLTRASATARTALPLSPPVSRTAVPARRTPPSSAIAGHRTDHGPRDRAEAQQADQHDEPDHEGERATAPGPGMPTHRPGRPPPASLSGPPAGRSRPFRPAGAPDPPRGGDGDEQERRGQSGGPALRRAIGTGVALACARWRHTTPRQIRLPAHSRKNRRYAAYVTAVTRGPSMDEPSLGRRTGYGPRQDAGRNSASSVRSLRLGLAPMIRARSTPSTNTRRLGRLRVP
jgi:hypothetical protein